MWTERTMGCSTDFKFVLIESTETNWEIQSQLPNCVIWKNVNTNMDAVAFLSPLQDTLGELANHLNCSTSSLKVVTIIIIFVSLQWASDIARGDQRGTVWFMYSRTALWPPSSKQLIVCLLTRPSVEFCDCYLSASKSVCVANPFVPLWFILWTEHDTRVMAKERQKKDNHNLSKCLSLVCYSLLQI